MDREYVYKKSCEILADLTGLDIEEITSDSTLMEDLGIESFDLSDLNFKLKEIFKLKREYGFLSIEGIAGNQEMLTEDNRLTEKGMEEIEKRMPGYKISDSVQADGAFLMEVLTGITVDNLVEYLIAE